MLVRNVLDYGACFREKYMKWIFALTVLSLVVASAAMAQAEREVPFSGTSIRGAPPPASAPQPPPQPLPPDKTIQLDLALEAAQAALAFCKANISLAFVEVMDANKTPIVVLGADGARPNLAGLARRKAYTVITKGMSSGDFGKMIGPRDRNAPPIE